MGRNIKQSMPCHGNMRKNVPTLLCEGKKFAQSSLRLRVFLCAFTFEVTYARILNEKEGFPNISSANNFQTFFFSNNISIQYRRKFFSCYIHLDLKVGSHLAKSHSERSLRQVTPCVLLQNKSVRQGAWRLGLWLVFQFYMAKIHDALSLFYLYILSQRSDLSQKCAYSATTLLSLILSLRSVAWIQTGLTSRRVSEVFSANKEKR